jgi:Holliday junction DNA helicase RuvB
MLLHGNPGLGKTTLAKIVAEEFGVKFHEVMAGSINTAKDIDKILGALSDDTPDILFIDEIHRLPLKLEELLYPVMEDGFVELENEHGELERFWVPPFTLIGATTVAGDLSRPLRDRFGMHFQLQNYQVDEVVQILRKLSEREGFTVDHDALYDIARRGKGVARIAINFLYRCKEYSDFFGSDTVTTDITRKQFDLMGIDEIGLDEGDYKVLEYLSTQSRPVGLAALSTAVDIDRATIENIIEPYLAQTGMINRTRSGREITERGRSWVNGGQQVTVENSPVRQVATGSVRRVGQR